MSADYPHAIDARRSQPGREPGASPLFLMLLTLLLAACTVAPSAPVAQPIGDPAVEAETRLWYQASTAFSDGRYSAAIHLYERYLTTYPKSRRAMEAHWDLGQAYEQMGEVTAAVKEYRTLAGPEGASPATLSSYADRALHRIEALRNQPALSAGTRSGHTALYVSFNNLPPHVPGRNLGAAIKRPGDQRHTVGCQPGIVLHEALGPYRRCLGRPITGIAKRCVVCHVTRACTD